MRQLAVVILLSAVLSSGLCVFWFAEAVAQERVSPKYLWEPTRSISSARLLFCGEPAGSRRGARPARIAIYRDMQYRYFTTENERSLVYDIPLQVSSWEGEGRTHFRFRMQDADGKKRVYAEILSQPGESPVWLRHEGEALIEVPCKSYRFSAEFIPYSRPMGY